MGLLHCICTCVELRRDRWISISTGNLLGSDKGCAVVGFFSIVLVAVSIIPVWNAAWEWLAHCFRLHPHLQLHNYNS